MAWSEFVGNAPPLKKKGTTILKVLRVRRFTDMRAAHLDTKEEDVAVCRGRRYRRRVMRGRGGRDGYEREQARITSC